MYGMYGILQFYSTFFLSKYKLEAEDVRFPLNRQSSV